MNQKTSLKLSKLLAEAGFDEESEYAWMKPALGAPLNVWGIYPVKQQSKMTLAEPAYLAYDLLWDLCIKHGKKVFGEAKHVYNWGAFGSLPAYQARVFEVIALLQQGKDPEDYIISNSILLNKDK